MKTSEAIEVLEYMYKISTFSMYTDKAEALRQAIDLMKRSQWQSIESAPMDGTKILMLKKGHVFTAYWDEFIDEWFIEKDCVVRKPTHWMQLPGAPEEAK